MTGTCFSSASSRMRRKSSADCTAEPPGELTTTATATRLATRNARSIAAAWLASETPSRRGRDMITPSNRSTATTGERDHSRSMRSWRRILIRSQDGKPCRPRLPARLPGRSELEPPPFAQHRFGGGGKAPVRLVQDEAKSKPRRCGDLLAGANEDTAGRPALPRPQRKNYHLAGAPGDLAEQVVDPIRPMDECDRALGADHRQRKAHPSAEICCTFDRRFGLDGCRRGSGPAGLVEWRVRHDVVKGTGRQTRWRMRQIADHHR